MWHAGGESQFANMKSYLLSSGCENLVDKGNFDKKDMNSKWGAYDNVVYKRVLAESATKKTPFFTTVLTLTNHEPFELPAASHFKGDEIENKFRSTSYYADSCLGAFIREARQQPWYQNTLFVVVADHGHHLPKNQSEIFDSHRYRIPLLFFGEAIKPQFRGTKISKVGSQTDITFTLLNQLNLPVKDYHWGKDLLNPEVKGHAFYSWDNGFGFVNDQNAALSIDRVSKNVIYKTDGMQNDGKRLEKHAKSYMQSVFQQYLEY